MAMSRAPGRCLPLLLALGFLIGVMLCVSGAHWRVGAIGDPDSFMRLAYLDQLAHAGTLGDGKFARDGAPFGMVLHWTWPFDALVLGLALPSAPLVGWHAALAAAGPWVAPVSALLLVVAIARLCAAVGRADAAPFAVLIAALSPPIFGYGAMGRVNHHLFAVALGVFAIAASIRLVRSGRRIDAAVAAAWSVIALWESMECAMPAAIALAVVALGAMGSGGARRAGYALFAILAPLLALCVVLADPAPDGRWDLDLDRFSALQLGFFVAGGAMVLRARGLAGVRGPRFWGGAVAAAAPMALWAATAIVWHRPVLAEGVLYRAYFWDRVAELMPVWRAGLAAVALWALPLALAAAVLLNGLARSRSRPIRLGLLIALAALAAEALAGAASIRLGGHAAVLEAVVLGASLQRALRRRTRDWSGAVQRAILGGAMLVACCGGGLVAAAPIGRTAEEGCWMDDRTVGAIEAALPPDAVVAADLWLTPELLWRTDLRGVAGPYHRNARGIEDLARIFMAPQPKVALATLRARGAAAVLACTDAGFFTRAQFPPHSLGQRILDGDAVPGLRPVPLPPGSRLRLFQVSLLRRGA